MIAASVGPQDIQFGIGGDLTGPYREALLDEMKDRFTEVWYMERIVYCTEIRGGETI